MQQTRLEGQPKAGLTWQHIHEELARLAEARATLDYDEGCWLLAALRSNVHARLGFGSFKEYVHQLFGHAPRLIEEKLRVAHALEELPEMARALDQATICWSAARELTRVAVPDTEREWLEAARGKAARQVERLVSGLSAGDRPGARKKDELERHVLRLEVSGETLATFREAVAALQRSSGEGLSEEDALLEMARQVLGGPADDGRASYQIALTRCIDCERTWQQGRGERVRVSPEMAEMASCDAQHIGLPVSPHVGGCTDDARDAHVGGADAAGDGTRATQTIPPATRRLVMRRDGGCCVVGGCRNATWVDVHHLRLRSEGGTHDPNRLACMCSAHHRAVHRGALIIDGTVDTGLEFFHADGRPYGQLGSPVVAGACAEAFAGLRALGFRESEAHAAIAAVREQWDGHEPMDPGEVVRRALRATSRSARVGERAAVYRAARPGAVPRVSERAAVYRVAASSSAAHFRVELSARCELRERRSVQLVTALRAFPQRAACSRADRSLVGQHGHQSARKGTAFNIPAVHKTAKPVPIQRPRPVAADSRVAVTPSPPSGIDLRL